MSGRWGPEGPPDEAYSRITNPERFLKLREFASSLVDVLEATYDVDGSTGFNLDPELEGRRNLARPSRRLVPRGNGKAPLTVVFTDFPGLLVRFGVSSLGRFPACGCDACDEDSENQIAELAFKVDALTHGNFHEKLWLTLRGARQWSEFSSERGSRATGGSTDRERAMRLLGRSRYLERVWQPWSRRAQPEG